MKLSHLKNKKILITGHTGFVGSWLSMIMHINKIEFYGISLKPHFENKLYYSMKRKKIFKNKEYIFDMCKYNILKEKINIIKPDYIFHLAAQSSVVIGYKNPAETYKNNFLTTLNLMETLRNINFKTHVLFSTTDKVYSTNYPTPFAENSPLGGKDPYSNSKDFSDIVVQNYYNNFLKNKKITMTIFRAGNIIGGGDRNKHRLISDILNSLENKKKIYLRAPNYVRPWQHVLDLCNAIIVLSKYFQGKRFFSIYNLGTKENINITVKKLTNLFLQKYYSNNQKLKKKNLIFYKKKKLKETKKLILNNGKFHLTFKNVYKLSQKDSIEWTVEWFQREKEGVDNYIIAQDQLTKYDKKK